MAKGEWGANRGRNDGNRDGRPTIRRGTVWMRWRQRTLHQQFDFSGNIEMRPGSVSLRVVARMGEHLAEPKSYLATPEPLSRRAQV